MRSAVALFWLLSSFYGSSVNAAAQDALAKDRRDFSVFSRWLDRVGQYRKPGIASSIGASWYWQGLNSKTKKGCVLVFSGTRNTVTYTANFREIPDAGTSVDVTLFDAEAVHIQHGLVIPTTPSAQRYYSSIHYNTGAAGDGSLDREGQANREIVTGANFIQVTGPVIEIPKTNGAYTVGQLEIHFDEGMNVQRAAGMSADGKLDLDCEFDQGL